MGRQSAGIARAGGIISALCLSVVSLSLFGCDEEKKTGAVATASATATAEPPAPPPPKRAPEFGIDDISPKVGFNRAVLFKPDGKPNPEGQTQLVSELAEA